MKLYLIGSLRNPAVPKLAALLRAEGHETFDDWYSAGPEADDYWQRYEQGRGHSYPEALTGYAAQHVFLFDKLHLDAADGAVLVLPAGKSGHLEFGYIIGQGKPGYILMDKEPDRWDVMYAFATGVLFNENDLCQRVNADSAKKTPSSVLAVSTTMLKNLTPQSVSETLNGSQPGSTNSPTPSVVVTQPYDFSVPLLNLPKHS